MVIFDEVELSAGITLGTSGSSVLRSTTLSIALLVAQQHSLAIANPGVRPAEIRSAQTPGTASISDSTVTAAEFYAQVRSLVRDLIVNQVRLSDDDAKLLRENLWDLY